MDGFVVPQAASAASIAPQSSTPSYTAAKLKLINDGTGKYVFKTTSLEIIYDKNASKISWSLKSGATVTSLKEEMTAKGVTTIAVSGGEMKLPDSDGDGTPDLNESATSVVTDANPTRIDLANYTDPSQLNLADLGVGKGYMLWSTRSDLAKVNGTTITKTSGIDSTRASYLIDFRYSPNSSYNFVALIDARNPDKYVDALLDSSGINFTSEQYSIVSNKPVGSSSYKYSLAGDKSVGSNGIKAYTHGLGVVDASNNPIALMLHQRLAQDGVEFARITSVVKAGTSFTIPSGSYAYTGDAFLGESPSKAVYGQAQLNVNFDTATGSFAASSLARSDNASTGSLSGTFNLNTANGMFAGTASGQVDSLSESGTLIGTFNSSADLAVGVADFDKLEGTFVVAR